MIVGSFRIVRGPDTFLTKSAKSTLKSWLLSSESATSWIWFLAWLSLLFTSVFLFYLFTSSYSIIFAKDSSMIDDYCYYYSSSSSLNSSDWRVDCRNFCALSALMCSVSIFLIIFCWASMSAVWSQLSRFTLSFYCFRCIFGLFLFSYGGFTAKCYLSGPLLVPFLYRLLLMEGIVIFMVNMKVVPELSSDEISFISPPHFSRILRHILYSTPIRSQSCLLRYFCSFLMRMSTYFNILDSLAVLKPFPVSRILTTRSSFIWS